MKSDLGFLDEIEVEVEQLASTLHYYRFFTTTYTSVHDGQV